MWSKRPSLTNNKEIFDQLKFRTRFKVAIAEWNPKIDLIALGSSEGEIMVKRYLWKTGWKKNLHCEKLLKKFESLVDDVPASSSNAYLLLGQQDNDELLSLCWSPDGQVLLAGFSSGKCYYLDTQSGNTLFVRKLGYVPMKINWLKYKTKERIKCLKQRELPLTISASDFNFREDAPKEHRDACAFVEHFYREILYNSMAGTFLCVLHLDGTSTSLEIFVNGILPVQRLSIEQTLSAVLKHPISSNQISTKNIYLKNDKFYISFSFDDENLPPVLLQKFASSDANAILEISGLVTSNRLRIYNQIADCLGWISFCYLYLQEMFDYCAQNWKQASEAFHQRVFATFISHRASISDGVASSDVTTPVNCIQSAREGSLQMCRDLLVVLDDGDACASDMLDKFLSLPTAEKELKQASNFVDSFTFLVKGILNGLLPAAQSLLYTIYALRNYFIHLRVTLDEEDNSIDPEALLLDTLLKIARDHPQFDSIEGLSESCTQFLNNFEHEVLLLQRTLQKVLKLAAQNRNELKQLVHWLIALIFESGNECTSVIDESEFDVKLLNKFITETVNCSGLNSTDKQGKCILDRVFNYMVVPSQNGKDIIEPEVGDEQMDCANTTALPAKENIGNKTEKGAAETDDDFVVDHEDLQFDAQFPLLREAYPNFLMCKQMPQHGGGTITEEGENIWQRIKQCVQHFRVLYKDGIINFFPSPVNLENFRLLAANSTDIAEEGGNDNQQMPHHHESASSSRQQSDDEEVEMGP